MLNGNLMLEGLGLDQYFARISSGSATSFLTDGLGSTIALTNSSAATTASFAYGPYGNVSASGSDSTPFQFTGRENDGTANLYYYRARYYNPTFGQFISADPLGLAVGINPYAYARGNPLSYRDPTGKEPLDYYVQWVNFVNLLSNLNFNLFGFASAETSFPAGSPVRVGVDNVAIGGYSTQDGFYVGSIGALGVEFGGEENYYAYYGGEEWTLECRGPQQEWIQMQEISLGVEIPFLAGYGGGGGSYTAEDDAGYFLFLSGGALGENVSIGFGAGAGLSNGPYTPIWGGAFR